MVGSHENVLWADGVVVFRPSSPSSSDEKRRKKKRQGTHSSFPWADWQARKKANASNSWRNTRTKAGNPRPENSLSVFLVNFGRILLRPPVLMQMIRYSRQVHIYEIEVLEKVCGYSAGRLSTLVYSFRDEKSFVFQRGKRNNDEVYLIQN